MRNHACTVEAVRLRSNQVRNLLTNRHSPDTNDSDYPLLREIAKHMIHVSETLAVALESVKALRKQQEDFLVKQSPWASLWNSTQYHLQFQHRMIRNLFLGSESSKARLQNEITLARYSV